MTRRAVTLLAFALLVGCGPSTAPSSKPDFKVPTLPAGRQNDGMMKPEKK
jgi:hypothetical protein